MNPEKLHAIFKRLRAANPLSTTELHYGNVFQLLVAVALSAQATDKGVNKAIASIFKIANVILNTAFSEPTIAVDTHIFRVSNRISLAPGKTPLDVVFDSSATLLLLT